MTWFAITLWVWFVNTRYDMNYEVSHMIWYDTCHGLWHDNTWNVILLYMRYCYVYNDACETFCDWKWYVMTLLSRIMVYDYCTCLTWLKRKGNQLDVLVLAWYMFTVSGLRNVQERSVWVTSGIHVTIMFYMITKSGLRGIRNKSVWATSGIHTSTLVGRLRDIQNRSVWDTSGIHASICLASITCYLTYGSKVIWIPEQYWTK